MQNIISNSRIIKRYLTGGEKIIVFGLLIIVFGFMFSGSAFADNVNYSVNIAPSLKLTIPDSSLVLNLAPPTKTFDSKNLTVTVGTNNATGYKLTLSTPNDDTNLNRDSSGDSVSATIPTLDAGTYTESTFTANKWGYKINTNTAIPSIITTGYIPFVSGNTLMERDTAINHDETELAFASKIDYLQPSGAYNTTLQFNIVANPLVNYMQDLNPALCTTTPMTVVDKRDNREYYIARLTDGNCWMLQNLRLGQDTTTLTLTQADSDVQASGFTLDGKLSDGRFPVTGTYYNGSAYFCREDYGCYYNWYTATAGSGTSAVSSGNADNSICPKGWTLPTQPQYASLATSYGGTGAAGARALLINPITLTDNTTGQMPGFTVAGGYAKTGASVVGERCGYWSRTAYAAGYAYRIYVTTTAVTLNSNGEKHYGQSTRCLLRE